MYRFKMLAFLAISIFFLIVGVDLLIFAYRLNDPFTFVLTFFAANLMILISAALGLGFALRFKQSFTVSTPKDTAPKQ